MKTDFENLRLNDTYQYETDSNGDKQTVKIYDGENLIAKKIKLKKSIRYFAIDGYQKYLVDEV
ncbi:MAG: hypothetical protein ACI9LM_004093 [Alteromonadaceae bacterium]|jgi:hypothetical protein